MSPVPRQDVPAVSPAFLIALAVSATLGALGGSAFRWAPSRQAWDLFIAAFLWTLIAAAGTTIGRCAGEHLRRGSWRRGLWIAHAQSLPLTTLFLLAAALVGPGLALIPAVAPVLFGATLIVALALAALCVLGSPYR